MLSPESLILPLATDNFQKCVHNIIQTLPHLKQSYSRFMTRQGRILKEVLFGEKSAPNRPMITGISKKT